MSTSATCFSMRSEMRREASQPRSATMLDDCVHGWVLVRCAQSQREYVGRLTCARHMVRNMLFETTWGSVAFHQHKDTQDKSANQSNTGNYGTQARTLGLWNEAPHEREIRDVHEANRILLSVSSGRSYLVGRERSLASRFV